MSPTPRIVFTEPPATPGGPVAAGEDVLGTDALALAPEVVGDAPVAPDVLSEEALPAVVPEDARTRLERVFRDPQGTPPEARKGPRIDAVFRAVRDFNGTVGDGRAIDELTLGLLWLSESAAQLTVTLDPEHPSFAVNHTLQIKRLAAIQQLAQAEMRRAWRITNIGLWGFGLDDFFLLDVDRRGTPVADSEVLAEFEMAVAAARWSRRLHQDADWMHSVPFAAANGATDPPLVTALEPLKLSYTTNEAVGFLVGVASRFTKQLYLLPAELANRGIVLSTAETERIPLVEPVLAYLCYLQKASKAAAIWEALLFLLDLSSAVSLSAPLPAEPGIGYDLFHLIDALNRWRGPLRDDATLGLPAMLRSLLEDAAVTLPGGRDGRTVLGEVAARTGWDTIPPEAQLDADGRALLEELVEAWTVFGVRVAQMPPRLPPGELVYLGGLQDASPRLFRSDFGNAAYAGQNYGRRYREATNLPAGGACRREPVAP